MDGAAIMDESEEAELTPEQTWDCVKDFIIGDHLPPPTCRPKTPRSSRHAVGLGVVPPPPGAE